MTVDQYATRWMLGYGQAPRNTRLFHQTNIERFVLPHLGHRGVSS